MSTIHTAKVTLSTRPREQGAALIIGLLLLLILTVLAVSGMSTASLELQMAGNVQYGQNAFQAAEMGIEQSMNSGQYNANVNDPMPLKSTTDHFDTMMRFNDKNGVTDVPEGGYSMGVGTGFKAYHFDITSTGDSTRGASSTHQQSFYIKGQSSD
jgi:type IV pilus assembly protein PilX